jgi:hypothetical protein
MSENEPKITPTDTKCNVCDTILAYAAVGTQKKCETCGKEENAYVYCPEGHYICFECDSKPGLEILDKVVSATDSNSPTDIFELVMADPEVPINGSIHGALVAVTILTAVKNLGHQLPETAMAEALERASHIPESCGGLFGLSASAIGAGIAVSIVTGASSLTTKSRSFARTAVSYAASYMMDNQPRCAIRESRIAVMETANFLRDFMNIELPRSKKIRCVSMIRNYDCSEDACPFFSGRGMEEKSMSYLD